MESILKNVEHVSVSRVNSYVLATIEITASNRGEINTLMRDLNQYARDMRFPTSSAMLSEPIVVENPELSKQVEESTRVEDIDFDLITGAPRNMS